VLVVPPLRHPALRLALVTLLAIGVAVLCEAFWVNSMALTRESREYQRVLADFLKDGESLYAAYQRAPRFDIKLKSADHTRGGSKYPLDVVMFGDFQCYHCRRMARLIEDVNRKFFKGALRVVFKHFPLNQECNPYVSATPHAQACQAARAAEAAYLQNPDAFWKAHDVLFAAQSQLARADYRTFAAKLGLDPERFVRDMESQTVSDRIQQDVELGNSLGIKGTPRVYVSSREVPDAAMWQMTFWQTVAEHYDAAARQLQAKQAAPPPHGH
jgi:protein-disulfide isomerase